MRNYSLPLFNSSIRQSNRDGANGNLIHPTLPNCEPEKQRGKVGARERGEGEGGELDLIAVQKLKVNHLKAMRKHNAPITQLKRKQTRESKTITNQRKQGGPLEYRNPFSNLTGMNTFFPLAC